jgi:hypothetical protein
MVSKIRLDARTGSDDGDKVTGRVARRKPNGCAAFINDSVCSHCRLRRSPLHPCSSVAGRRQYCICGLLIMVSLAGTASWPDPSTGVSRKLPSLPPLLN